MQESQKVIHYILLLSFGGYSYNRKLKQMKQSFLSAILLFSVILLIGCSDRERDEKHSDSWESALENQEGRLTALYVPAEGFAYRDESDRLTGFTVELLRGLSDFAREVYGVELEIEFEEEQDWSVFYDRIRRADDGKIGLGNVTITDDRKEELSFSPPYMYNIAALITHANRSVLNSREQIAETFHGLSALAFEGTLHEQRLHALVNEYFPEAGVEMAHTNDEILDRVSSEDRYFAYIDLYNYQRAVNRGLALQRHPVADEAEEEFGYIMPLNSSWEPLVTEYFEQGVGLIRSDRYRELMREHLGPELTAVLLENVR